MTTKPPKRPVVKRDDYGYFTTSPATSMKMAEKQTLCGSCGRQSSCNLPGIQREGRTRDHWAVIDVVACDIFVPQIIFYNPHMPEGRWNTLRLGDRSSFLQKGQQVQIIDPSGAHLSFARVTSVIVGDKDIIIEEHARFNHSVKDMNLKKQEKTDYIKRKLPQHYHSHLWARTTQVTAVYLKAIPELTQTEYKS